MKLSKFLLLISFSVAFSLVQDVFATDESEKLPLDKKRTFDQLGSRSDLESPQKRSKAGLIESGQYTEDGLYNAINNDKTNVLPVILKNYCREGKKDFFFDNTERNLINLAAQKGNVRALDLLWEYQDLESQNFKNLKEDSHNMDQDYLMDKSLMVKCWSAFHQAAYAGNFIFLNSLVEKFRQIHCHPQLILCFKHPLIPQKADFEFGFSFLDIGFAYQGLEFEQWFSGNNCPFSQKESISDVLYQSIESLLILKDNCLAKEKSQDTLERLVKQFSESNNDSVIKLLNPFIKWGELEDIKKLINHESIGGKVNIKFNQDYNGWEDITPLHLAAFWGRAEVVAYLLGNGADVNSQSATLDTPLLFSLYYGGDQQAQIQIINSMIRHNVNLNLVNDKGTSPIHTVLVKCSYTYLDRNYRAIRDLLLSQETLNIKIKDQDGLSAEQVLNKLLAKEQALDKRKELFSN